MNEVVGCEAIILPTSPFPSQPLCHGPSHTAHLRIQGPAPSAATGPGGARGFAPGSLPLPARGPLSPAHGDPVAGPAAPLRTREQPFSPLSALVPGRGPGAVGGDLRRGTGTTVPGAPGHHPCPFPPGFCRCPAEPGRPGHAAWCRSRPGYGPGPGTQEQTAGGAVPRKPRPHAQAMNDMSQRDVPNIVQGSPAGIHTERIHWGLGNRIGCRLSTPSRT